jgi:predicted permease
MFKFFFTFGLIVSGLSIGYGIQALVRRKVLDLPLPLLDRLRRFLVKLALLFINPIAIVGALWTLRMNDGRLAAFPVLEVFAILLGGFLALGASMILKLERKKAGSLFACGFFTNTYSIGGLICYVFLGEMGFAFVAFYRIFEEFIYYGIGFPIARLYSAGTHEKESWQDKLKRLGTDIFVLVSLSSLFTGGLLNFSGLRRPEVYQVINSVLIPVGTLALLVSIGLAMRIKTIQNYLKECVVISAIKFLIVPAILTLTALLLGYGKIEEGLPLKVVMILSSMPVAFTALVPPSLYNLDIDLANSCWLFSTSLLILVLPVLYIATNSL